MSKPISERSELARTGKLRIAAVQMISGPDIAANLSTAGHWIAEAARQGAQLVALPEYFPIIGAADSERVLAAEPDGSGRVQDFLAETAHRHGIWLIAGSLPLAATSTGKMKNSCVVYSPAGERVARYDKIHLFAFTKGSESYDEASFIEAGRQLVAVDTPSARIGLSICYDLRFPELYRALGKEKPLDLIVVPAAFTETTGRAHWEILLRARAIENQCYVMAIGQGGVHPNGRETHGNSMIIDPWGTILDRKLKGPGVVIADLDHQLIAEVRASLPALHHRIL
jgi:predicted amidohydrolase